MKVTISRDGVVIGIYQRKDIRAAVADVRLNSDDRYFMQGMSEWLPLSTLIKTLGGYIAEDESIPNDQRITTTAKRSWKRLATSAGYAIVRVAARSALQSRIICRKPWPPPPAACSFSLPRLFRRYGKLLLPFIRFRLLAVTSICARPQPLGFVHCSISQVFFLLR